MVLSFPDFYMMLCAFLKIICCASGKLQVQQKPVSSKNNLIEKQFDQPKQVSSKTFFSKNEINQIFLQKKKKRKRNKMTDNWSGTIKKKSGFQ